MSMKAKKVVCVKVWEVCSEGWYRVKICGGSNGRKILAGIDRGWERKPYAVRAAKGLAKELGIPYDSEVIKQHGC